MSIDAASDILRIKDRLKINFWGGFRSDSSWWGIDIRTTIQGRYNK